MPPKKQGVSNGATRAGATATRAGATATRGGATATRGGATATRGGATKAAVTATAGTKKATGGRSNANAEINDIAELKTLLMSMNERMERLESGRAASADSRSSRSPATESRTLNSRSSRSSPPSKRKSRSSRSKSPAPVKKSRRSRSRSSSAASSTRSASPDSGDDVGMGLDLKELLGDYYDNIGQNENDVRELLLADLPMGSAVGKTLLEKIRGNKYVDLALLLPKVTAEAKPKLANLVMDEDKKLKVKRSVKPIASIAEFRRAFDIFIAVYCGKKGNEKDLPGLLSYANTVQELADDGYDWWLYDVCYRQDRGAKKNPPSWGAINQVFYNRIMRKGQNSKTVRYQNFQKEQSSYSHQSASQSNQSVSQTGYSSGGTPKGYCFAFHARDKRCSRYPCNYDHECFKCHKSNHPAYSCRNAKRENPKSRDNGERRYDNRPRDAPSFPHKP